MFARLLSYEVRSDVFLQADLWLLLLVLTTFIQACSLNRKRKAHKITCLYPLEIPDLKPPDLNSNRKYPPCLRNSSSKNPPCLRNSKKPSVVLYGYFLELPNRAPDYFTVNAHYNKHLLDHNLVTYGFRSGKYCLHNISVFKNCRKYIHVHDS